MERLTAKQDRFAQLIVAGETQVAAYRMAYRTKASAKVIAVDASRLAAKPAVSGRIAELQAQAAQGVVWALTARLADLAGIARDPANSASERIRAIEVYTRLAGDMPAAKAEVTATAGAQVVLLAWRGPAGEPVRIATPLSVRLADGALDAGEPEPANVRRLGA